MRQYRTRFAAALMVLGLCCGACAADYPSKPIRMVVPYPAGGATDILTRMISKEMSVRLGQPVIVDNRPGAGGSIGTALVAQSPPDGYTLVLSNYGPMIFNPLIQPNLTYDSRKDFAPISVVAVVTAVLVVPASTPVKTVPELIAYEKARHGQLFYGSTGVGSGTHFYSELFNIVTGTKFMHMPYKGGAPANIGIMTGEVTMYISPLVDALPNIRSGKVRALAVVTAARSPLEPDLPTVAESVPGFVMDTWFGVLAPAGTPRVIVDLLNRAIAAVVEQPDLRLRMLNLGIIPTLDTPDEFGAMIKTELVKWAKVVKEAGIAAE